MLYRVTKIYARGNDIAVAEFNEQNDAKLFMQAKLSEDARLKVKVTYRLYEGMELMEEMSEAESTTSQGQGAQQTARFQPTPFNTAPRPTGMPQNWLKDQDDKKKDEK